MRIRDIAVHEVASGRVWRVADAEEAEPLDWEIESATVARDDDTVVYSALVGLRTGEVRPLLLIREVGTYEWWGDTLEYVDGVWRLLGGGNEGEWDMAETFVASPLPNDLSFTGEYSPEQQREGFGRLRERLLESVPRGPMA